MYAGMRCVASATALRVGDLVYTRYGLGTVLSLNVKLGYLAKDTNKDIVGIKLRR